MPFYVTFMLLWIIFLYNWLSIIKQWCVGISIFRIKLWLFCFLNIEFFSWSRKFSVFFFWVYYSITLILALPYLWCFLFWWNFIYLIVFIFEIFCPLPLSHCSSVLTHFIFIVWYSFLYQIKLSCYPCYIEFYSMCCSFQHYWPEC